jgi:hypothetical protein
MASPSALTAGKLPRAASDAREVWDTQTGQVAFRFNGSPFVSFDLSPAT